MISIEPLSSVRPHGGWVGVRRHALFICTALVVAATLASPASGRMSTEQLQVVADGCASWANRVYASRRQQMLDYQTDSIVRDAIKGKMPPHVMHVVEIKDDGTIYTMANAWTRQLFRECVDENVQRADSLKE